MKKCLFAFLTLAVLIFPFHSESLSAGEKITLQFGHVLAHTHPYHLGALKFAEILKNTPGVDIEVQAFHSSQLGNERDLTEGMQLGTVDLALVPGTIALFEPKMAIFDLPYIIRDRQHAYAVLDGPIGEEVAKDLPSKGLRLLAYWENGYRNVTNSKRAIVKPEDMQGIKIRTSENQVHVEYFKALGANVTTMAFGEVFTALQQKTVDAQENPLAIIVSSKFYEAQPYLSRTEHCYMPAHLLISEARWQSLPPEAQQAVREAAIEARDYERQLMIDNDELLLEELRRNNIQINEIDKTHFMKIAEATVWKTYENQFGELRRRIMDHK